MMNAPEPEPCDRCGIDMNEDNGHVTVTPFFTVCGDCAEAMDSPTGKWW